MWLPLTHVLHLGYIAAAALRTKACYTSPDINSALVHCECYTTAANTVRDATDVAAAGPHTQSALVQCGRACACLRLRFGAFCVLCVCVLVHFALCAFCRDCHRFQFAFCAFCVLRVLRFVRFGVAFWSLAFAFWDLRFA